MSRVLAVLAGLFLLCPVTGAAVAPAKKAPARAEAKAKAKALKGTTQVRAREVPPSASADFQITVASEVRLNGRSCRFKEVPDNAVITKIVVDQDSNEVLIIHFSTEK